MEPANTNTYTNVSSEQIFLLIPTYLALSLVSIHNDSDANMGIVKTIRATDSDNGSQSVKYSK